jgi:hypothetical protein
LLDSFIMAHHHRVVQKVIYTADCMIFCVNERRMEGYVIRCSRTFKTTAFSEPIDPSFHCLFSYEVFSRNICVCVFFSVFPLCFTSVPFHNLW